MKRASGCGRRLLPTLLLFRATNMWEANFTVKHSARFHTAPNNGETCLGSWNRLVPQRPLEATKRRNVGGEAGPFQRDPAGFLLLRG